MKLFLLRREISPYTFPDILLGCFTSLEKAQNARQKYVSQYESGEKTDPWREQGYKTIDLDEDVEIIDSLAVVDFHDTDATVFVVNSYFDGWGQVVREIYALCGTQESAQEILNEVRTESLDNEFFKAEKIWLDKLYADDDLQNGYWWK